MPPISPNQIDKTQIIPEFVFDSFNELITKRYINNYSTVYQKEVVNLIKSKLQENQEFEQWWLNIEDAYRKSGWKVTYEKPDYTEIGESYFTFRN